MSQLKVLLVISVIYLLFGERPSASLKPIDVGINECPRIEVYPVNETKTYSYTAQVKNDCFFLNPFCKNYKTVTLYGTKVEVVYKKRNVMECCVGYGRRNGICLPVCKSECFHGYCANPDRCLCEEGWTGYDCNEECEDGYYGEDCDELCFCQNGAKCDKKNGTCYCKPGFTGILCESICPVGSFGEKCENKCHCKNGAKCDIENGICLCHPGYSGLLCENKCPTGTYGEECIFNCTCNKENTEFCSHIYGYCSCLPGYTGTSCNKKCQKGTWGTKCGHLCECPSNSTCNHISGICDCSPGRYGSHCKETCPSDLWGKDCSNSCQCINNSTCDPINGACSCQPGWIGLDCSIPCHEGTYGLKCSFLCNCTTNITCSHINGDCTCRDDLDDLTCSTGFLANINGISSNIRTCVIAASIILFIIVFASLTIFFSRKIKHSYEDDDYIDENSTSTVIENNAASEFSIETFMNPVYGEKFFFDEHVPSKQTSLRSSSNQSNVTDVPKVSETRKNSLYNEKNLDIGLDKSPKAKEKNNPFIAIKYTKNLKTENCENSSKNVDISSLYAISILDDESSARENPYAEPREILRNQP